MPTKTKPFKHAAYLVIYVRENGRVEIQTHASRRDLEIALEGDPPEGDSPIVAVHPYVALP